MNATFEWDERYRLGNEKIDSQHKNLIALTNAIAQSEGILEIQAAVMKVYKYTRTHFADEEELMRSVAFPHLEAHVRLHDKLISDLNAISAKDLETDTAVHEFKSFVYRWIVDHLMNHDRELVEFMHSLPKT